MLINKTDPISAQEVEKELSACEAVRLENEKLFPDSAEKYKGISSMLLLEEVVRVLEEKNFSIGNVDVTIIAQAPKLSPYMDEMRATVAKGLKIPLDRVSVKATTTEKMGFEGRKEGISAQAAAVLFQKA